MGSELYLAKKVKRPGALNFIWPKKLIAQGLLTLFAKFNVLGPEIDFPRGVQPSSAFPGPRPAIALLAKVGEGSRVSRYLRLWGQGEPGNEHLTINMERQIVDATRLCLTVARSKQRGKMFCGREVRQFYAI